MSPPPLMPEPPTLTPPCKPAGREHSATDYARALRHTLLLMFTFCAFPELLLSLVLSVLIGVRILAHLRLRLVGAGVAWTMVCCI